MTKAMKFEDAPITINGNELAAFLDPVIFGVQEAKREAKKDKRVVDILSGVEKDLVGLYNKVVSHIKKLESDALIVDMVAEHSENKEG